jgi:hypothetical protein
MTGFFPRQGVILMNGKILGSIFSIVVALALVSTSAYAVFTSAATNPDNHFGAGTLTLLINDKEGSLSTPIFDVHDLKPGQSSAVQSLVLKNSGSVDIGEVKLLGITVTPSPTPPPNLGDQVRLVLWDDSTANNVIDAGETVYGDADLTNSGWNNLVLTGITIPASGGTKTIKAKLTFESGAGNEYQGTNVNFSLNFQASQ